MSQPVSRGDEISSDGEWMMGNASSAGPGLNDSVTQHMRTDMARLRVDQTVGEALESLRKNPPESRIIYLYVVDENDHLKGVVPTRRLLLNVPDKPVGEIMVRDIIAIPHAATVLEACEFFTLHRLLAFPVVDALLFHPGSCVTGLNMYHASRKVSAKS